jgi:hypothetical protein
MAAACEADCGPELHVSAYQTAGEHTRDGSCITLTSLAAKWRIALAVRGGSAPEADE